MPTYKIIIRNLSDTAHSDPAPGCVKQALHTAPTLLDAEQALLHEIRRICSEPYTHYTWTITEIQG